MSKLINPCEACLKKYQDGKCDINNINSCCYDTLSSFYGGAMTMNDLRLSKEADNCSKCVLDKIHSLGKTRCDLKIDPPPVWNQIPHYFPRLFNQNGDVEKSKQQCLDMCNDNFYPNQCRENCLTDAYAVFTKQECDEGKHDQVLADEDNDPIQSEGVYTGGNDVFNLYIYLGVSVLFLLTIIIFLTF
jgi:hypothetical protein